MVNNRYGQILNNLISKGASFACYFLPDNEEPSLIIDEQPTVLEHYSDLNDRKGFVFAPFAIGNENPILLFNTNSTYKGFNEIEHLPEVTVNRTTDDEHFSTRKEEYENTFSQFMEALQNGSFSKLVLSRKHVEKRTDSNIGSIFLNAHEAYPAAFTYLVSTPQTGLWMGASPEVLLTGNSGEYKTVALAGTMPVSSSNHYSWNDKENEEQQIVADYIASQLESCGINAVDVSEKETVRAGNIVHLKTTFKFSADTGIGTLVKALHPTPAVCGLPKEESQAFILGTETHQREYYTGFIGIANAPDEVNLYVNLRCMKITGNQLVLFAGGGITAKSDAEKEWVETSHKFRTLLSILEPEKKNVLK